LSTCFCLFTSPAPPSSHLFPYTTLFRSDFGARRYQVRAAIASYDQSVATYRQTVLSAFQEVEDNLATLQVLARESVAERAAADRSEEHTSELQSRGHLVCRLLLEKKNEP